MAIFHIEKVKAEAVQAAAAAEERSVLEQKQQAEEQVIAHLRQEKDALELEIKKLRQEESDLKKALTELRQEQQAEEQVVDQLRWERSDWEEEQARQQAKITELDRQIAALEEKRRAADLALEAQRSEGQQELQKKLTAFQEARLAELNSQYESAGESLTAQAEQVEADREANKREKERLNRRNRQVQDREDGLDREVQELVTARCGQLVAQKEQELAALRSQLAEQSKALDEVRSFQSAYGREPGTVRQELKALQEANERLLAELEQRPGQELAAEYARLEKSKEELDGKYQDLSQRCSEAVSAVQEKDRLATECESWKGRCENADTRIRELESRCEEYRNRIQRLTEPEEQQSSREERIRAIRQGCLPMGTECCFGISDEAYSEQRFLDNVEKGCRDYGVVFPRRILYAFHTALKIADWSTITVLAGVSGTGKSELPRLYSKFGGLNYINVPVQPNWDSQESMLGYFNSIDNCFEPEALLRFLVQCTEEEQYKGCMSLILLDEMNLAHVEHYFAEFLSKLESRRGLDVDALPEVEIKLGSGLEPYLLKLSRTLLWSGTMNQDETTHSLSDKVLDRGILINFPRPKKLCSRGSMTNLEETAKGLQVPKLSAASWSRWLVQKDNLVGKQKEEMDSCREILEEINDRLGNVGRAVGHRVWQSIEHYILNYPTVIQAQAELAATPEVCSDELRQAIHTAFEDGLVQKVMPKLRGVETRGAGGQVLDNIKELLINEGFDNLIQDFDIACTQGYGQFIWNSANYISRSEENTGAEQSE